MTTGPRPSHSMEQLRYPSDKRPEHPIDHRQKLAFRDRVLQGRRKKSVPNIKVSPIIEVDDARIDSPTIPGRVPAHQRSASAPEQRSNAQMESAFLTEKPKFQGGQEALGIMNLCSSTRASSVLLPKDQDNGETRNSASDTSSIISLPSADLHPEIPPAVPPKSPNQQVLRRRPVESTMYSSPNGSLSTIASSKFAVKVPEISRKESPSTPACAHVPKPAKFSLIGSLVCCQKKADNREPHTYTTKPYHNRGHSHTSGPSSSTESTANSYYNAKDIKDQKHQPHPSVTEVDPTKGLKGLKEPRDLQPKRSRSQLSRMESFKELPPGFLAKEAYAKLDKPEVEALQKQAAGQAGRFQVLRQKDVDSLSSELRRLDERCGYLRNTYKSLRAGRQDLQSKIISELKSDRFSKFSRRSLLRQEEGMAELDRAIDSWRTKLDYAENRRTRVRQKLLEHVAAALIVAVPTCMEGSQTVDFNANAPQKEQFHQRDSGNVSRPSMQKRVESIKIYAGEGIVSLFADIENELGRMDEASASRIFGKNKAILI
ncbi:MAG: hypothetical protein M1834_003185 [Cirrosporium novae-zelandiae]|nr:MAG: hypothetical protein M1834_003185 [Cirrosporium novae-zelandiae]